MHKVDSTGVGDRTPKDRRGLDVLRDPLLNRGTAFTDADRDAYGLRGLLPAHVHTQKEQADRFLSTFRKLTDPLDKFVALNALHDRNEDLFFSILVDHIDDQFHFVDALEVRHLRRVAGFDQRLVARGHQRRDAAIKRRKRMKFANIARHLPDCAGFADTISQCRKDKDDQGKKANAHVYPARQKIKGATKAAPLRLA